MKASEQELAFHKRILSTYDPIAFAELCEWLYSRLVRQLFARLGSSPDPALVEEAISQTLLDYHDQPDRYDPEKLSLEKYLLMSAHRDYQNAIEKDRRHAGPGKIAVYLSGEQGEQLDLPDERQDIETLLTNLRASELWELAKARIQEPQEQQLLMLIINGVRTTAPYAKILGIQHLPPDDQAREVKRAKDRILKRLRRLGDEIDE